MGIKQSLENSILVSSLKGKEFRTKVPFVCYYSKPQGRWYMNVANDRTKALKQINMIITAPIEFTVTDIIYDFYLDTGFALYIVVKMDKIPLSNISFQNLTIKGNMIDGKLHAMILDTFTEGSTRAIIDNTHIEICYEIRLDPDYPTGIYIRGTVDNQFNMNTSPGIDGNILESLDNDTEALASDI